MAARRYRMTPARRAALRKAQLASARKRKRKKVVKRVRIGASVTALAGVGTAAYAGHQLRRTAPTQTYPSSRALGPARVRGNPLNYHAKTYDRKNRRWVSVPRGGAYRVPGGQFRPRAVHVQKLRPEYDAKRRATYAANRRKK